MITWLTSDLHFHHKRITELTNRGKFTTAENHTEWLINLWNKQVSKHDNVYHLGDFCFSSKYEDWASILRRLNGQKILVKGNHDDTKILNSLVTSGLIHAWYDYKETKFEETKVVLCHYPMRSWNKQGYGSIMLHGHCHGSLVDQGGKILDVGLDSMYDIRGKHEFITSIEVLDYMENRAIIMEDHHKDQTVKE